MEGAKRRPAAPGFVVLRQVADGEWRLLGEVARGGESYAAVLRSEWRVAMDWKPPK
jgi:hypothetical protein